MRPRKLCRSNGMLTAMLIAVLMAVLTVTLVFTAPLEAQEPLPEIRVSGRFDFTTVGDVEGRITLTFSEPFYKEMKSRGSAQKFLRNVASERADEEIAPGAVASYDDATSSMVLQFTELGAIENLGSGLWESKIEEPDMEYIGPVVEEGRQVAYFYITHTVNGFVWKGKMGYLLPRRATAPVWDPVRRTLRYTLPVAPAQGSGKLTAELKVKRKLMSGVYKVYGLGENDALDGELAAQWLGKLVLKNTGVGTLRDLRIRFRVVNYSEWSPWHKIAEVLPGQTVVKCYYPVLDPAIAKLRSNTPTDLLAEWQYSQNDGQARDDSDGRRIEILGVNEFVFNDLVAGESADVFADSVTNAPLLAAYVSRNDPVVKELAALANKRAGGVAAGQDDEQMLKALRAAYELLVANDFTYQHPPSVVDKSSSFDVKLVQNLKFPRDVIRDRSGTCIDLAMLYIAMMHAIGVDARLALVPGHALPVVQFPGTGQFAGIETTMVGGGAREGSVGVGSFDQAIEQGTKLLQEIDPELVVVVDVRDLWSKGVANPEMDDLPVNILREWGIREQGAMPAVSRPAGGVGPGRSGSTADPHSAIAGIWHGFASEVVDGSVVTYPVQVQIEQGGGGRYRAEVASEVQMQGAQGPLTLRFEGAYEGSFKDGELVLKSHQRTMGVAGSAMPAEALPPAKLKVRVVGGRLVGKEGSWLEGWSDFTLDRR